MVIVGDSGTGKSALLESFKKNYPSSVPKNDVSYTAVDQKNKVGIMNK